MLSIKYIQNKLSAIDNKISSSDSIIKLESDIDATILGVVKLYNGTQKVIEFVKEDEHYIARLIIDEEDAKYLSSVNFYIQVSNGSMSKKSNLISLEFDLASIKNDIKVHLSNEYKELLERINKIEEEVKYPVSRFVTGINISNKDLIKPGMIPVAVDEKGTFVALYPFSNHVTSVNGATAANGAVIIDASMIKYKATGKTIEETLADISDAIVAVKGLIDAISAEQREIRNQMNELDIKISRHISDGII